jgi:hypothetical protein
MLGHVAVSPNEIVDHVAAHKAAVYVSRARPVCTHRGHDTASTRGAAAECAGAMSLGMGEFEERAAGCCSRLLAWQRSNAATCSVLVRSCSNWRREDERIGDPT